jgi:hypothetical protein
MSYFGLMRKNKSATGELIPVEFADLPFVPQRIFIIRNVAEGSRRGDHAHRTCHQLILCTEGSFLVKVIDGIRLETFILRGDSEIGFPYVYVPPMIWITLTEFSKGSSCVVLASHPYSKEDYINDFNEYEKIKSALQ